MKTEQEIIEHYTKLGWKKFFRANGRGKRTPNGKYLYAISPTDGNKGGWQEYTRVPELK